MGSVLQTLGLNDRLCGAGCGSWLDCGGELLSSVSPIDGKVIGSVQCASDKEYEIVAVRAVQEFKNWRRRPAPQRGDIVRQIGNALRDQKKILAN